MPSQPTTSLLRRCCRRQKSNQPTLSAFTASTLAKMNDFFAARPPRSGDADRYDARHNTWPRNASRNRQMVRNYGSCLTPIAPGQSVGSDQISCSFSPRPIARKNFTEFGLMLIPAPNSASSGACSYARTSKTWLAQRNGRRQPAQTRPDNGNRTCFRHLLLRYDTIAAKPRGHHARWGGELKKGTATLTDNRTARRRLEMLRFATVDRLNISGIIDPPFVL